MNTPRPDVLVPVLTALALAASTTVLPAHGGQYRGPGAALPPSTGNGSGGSSTAPGDTVSGSGGGSSSGSGGNRAGPTPHALPSAPSASGAGGAGGMPILDDPTAWQSWWEFNKDPFLDLKRTVHALGVVAHSDEHFLGAAANHAVDTLRPTQRQIRQFVVPALHRTLAAETDRDIRSSCLIALAKVGVEHPAHPFVPAIRPFLASHDQEIRETAALALGIARRPEAIPELLALARDTESGRALTQRGRVDDRTRAFATYGLGLVLDSTRDAPQKQTILDALIDLARSTAGPNVQVAAVCALGLLEPEGIGAPMDRVHANRVLETLESVLIDEDATASRFARAQAPLAFAAVLRAHDDPVWTVRALREIRETLADPASDLWLRQSCTLALPRLIGPATPAEEVDTARALLWREYRRSTDRQSRSFALVGIGELGDPASRALLLEALRTGTKAIEKPWAALALGLSCRIGNVDLVTRRRLAGRVVRELGAVQNPATLASFSVALGLIGDPDVTDRLLALLDRHRHHSELAGYVCIGIALLGDSRGMELIRNVARSSSRRPTILLQSTIALGRLGDKRAADEIVARMQASGDHNLARFAAEATALGAIGDRRSIDPLLELLADEQRSDLARAFAAVALGSIADKELEPWNARYARLVNYRAAVETLSNGASGLLDLL